MIVFLVKFWEKLKSFVILVVAITSFFFDKLWNDIKNTFVSFGDNIKILWKFIVTGSAGDLMVKPSLISLIVYLFFSQESKVNQINDPGDYKVTVVGWKGDKPSDTLVQMVADYQMISIEQATEILESDNLRFELANGVKEMRMNELKKQFEDAGAILEIIRIRIDENPG